MVALASPCIRALRHGPKTSTGGLSGSPLVCLAVRVMPQPALFPVFVETGGGVVFDGASGLNRESRFMLNYASTKTIGNWDR